MRLFYFLKDTKQNNRQTWRKPATQSDESKAHGAMIVRLHYYNDNAAFLFPEKYIFESG
jgi:hypothetical protein